MNPVENYSVIKGSGNSGDIVLQNQEIAHKEGFGHVSKIWYDETISYDTALELLANEAAAREDLMVPRDAITLSFNSDGVITFNYDGREFIPTEHALRQFGTHADVSHTFINQMLRPEVLKPNGDVKYVRDAQDTYAFIAVLRNGLRRIPKDKKFRLRTYEDGTLRAFLTESYTPVDNQWYLEQIKKIIPGGRVSHWHFSNPDTLSANILIPDTIREEADSDYGGMISVGNCEIGTRRFEQFPSVFRAICMNGCIWDQTQGLSISQVHRGIDILALSSAIKTNIEAQIPLLPDGIERLLGIRKFGIGNTKLKNIFATVSVDYNFTQRQSLEVVSEFLNNESDNRNLFGVVNSITRAGQKFTPADWVKFDKLAGDLVSVNESEWNGILARANTVTDKVLEKVFG